MKRLAGHQAYFFPYIGYFTVLNAVDIFVYADSLQYEKKSWMNRNRIISEDGSIRYFNVPVKRSTVATPANEKEISYDKDWEGTILNQLGYYKKRAPYYADVVDLLQTLFQKKYDVISDLSVASVEIILKYLSIEKKTFKMSELINNPPYELAPDEWGIYACRFFEADGIDTFTNAPGGKEFYDTEKYRNSGLNIEFLQNNLRAYDQGLDTFAEGLSIIDVLMFNTVDEVRDMIEDYRVL